MSTIQLQFYISCSILTTLAFFYLIYNLFVSNRKSNTFDQIPQIDSHELMNDSITDIISNLPFDEINQPEQKTNDNQIITASAKKIIKSRKQRINNITNHHCRQYSNPFILFSKDFLPNSHLGLIEMKLLNKRFIKNNNKNNQYLSLIKDKKKKPFSSNFVKKYGFYKTSLVTIYEQLEY